MKAKPFDLEVFLSKADGGRTITQYRNGQVRGGETPATIRVKLGDVGNVSIPSRRKAVQFDWPTSSTCA